MSTGVMHTSADVVPVAVVSASAERFSALLELLEGIPSEPGFALILLQPLDPTEPGQSPELAGQRISLPVSEWRGDAAVEVNRLYCVPSGQHVVLEGQRLRLVPSEASSPGLRPIDRFFGSLAASRGEESVVVLLSGPGEDGCVGARQVLENGGVVFLPQASEAEHSESPLPSGDLETVLSPGEIGPALVRLLGSTSASPAEVPPLEETELAQVLQRLQGAGRHDFSRYKPSTIGRRLERRMGLMGMRSLPDYLQLLDEDPREGELLESDLLIGVTRFFRDAEAWDHLSDALTNTLLLRATADRPLRAWVAGCSSGEEAVTVAILLTEAFARAGREPNFQIFATDVSKRAIERARTGIYSAEAVAALSPRRRQRYFRSEGKEHHLVRSLRERILFSVHDLLRDPPFSHLDLVCCRNVLIYLKPEAQQRALAFFHFGLEPGGLLFLGAAESSSPPADGFETVSQHFRIHERVSSTHKEARPPSSRMRPPPPSQRSSAVPPATDPEEVTRSLLLEHFAPTAVLLDSEDRVLFEHGDTERFMGRPRGAPTQDVDALLHWELRGRVRQLLRDARATAQAVSIETELHRGEDFTLRIGALPLDERTVSGGGVLLTFLPLEARTEGDAPSVRPADDFLVRQLERELSEARLDLRTLKKDSETSQEELNASHEEVLSMNEELQSSNEELETSKEELQSVNEELLTVNAELKLKLAELEETNDDLVNLVESTRIPTIFLDREGCIKRFTPGIRSLFHVIPADLGRPLADLAPRFVDDALLEDVRRVMEELAPCEREVSTEDGTRYIRRAHPYRTRAAVMGGVVLSFIDVTSLHRAREAAQMLLTEVEHVFAHAPVGLAFIDREFRFVRINHQLALINGLPLEQHLGRSIRELFPRQATFFEDLLEEVWTTGRAKEGLTVQFTPVGEKEPRRFLSSYFPFRTENDEIIGALLSAHDITERERMRESLAQGQKMEAIGRLASGVAHDFNNVLQGVVGHTEVIAALTQDSAILQEVGEIEVGVRRAGEIVRQLVTFGSQRGDERAVIPLVATVREALQLVRASVPNSTELVIELPEEDRGISMAPSGVVQLLLNLVTNAHQAAPAHGKYEVLVRVRFDAEVDEAELSVVDRGRGMAKEVVARLFEPYFTTKGPHEGSGLGMSVVLGVVESAGGTVDVQSELGEGTRVTLRFPTVPLGAAAAASTTVPPPAGSGQRILLVDDEPAFVRSTTRLLRGQGYEVDGFTRPEDAMDRFAQAPENYAVIVTDFTMPGMSGTDLIDAARQHRPQLPALLCTGFWEASQDAPHNVKVLLKPVSVDVIARHLHAVLGDGDAH